jgi:hypothetical protein
LAEGEMQQAIERLGDAPPPTNLDRALAPADRARERAARHPEPAQVPTPAEVHHFVVALDRARLRIFSQSQPRGQRQPSLQLVQAIDFPHGRQNYFDRDTDQQGQFPGGGSAANGTPQGSIDERLPTELEEERRLVVTITETLHTFLRAYPAATWDLAAEARLQREILERLAHPLRDRLRQSVAKDLSKQSANAILAHFSTTPSSHAKRFLP